MTGPGRGIDPVHRRWSRPAKRALKLLAFALVVHVFVIPQIGGARKALDVIGSLNPFLVGLAVVLEAVSFAAYARLTQLLVPMPSRPSLPVTFGTVMASTGINHVVPGGAATTATVNYRLLGQAGVPADQLGFALGLQAIGSAVVLNVLLWAALVVSIPTSGFHPIYATAACVGVVLIGVFSAAVMAMLRDRDALANRVVAVVGRLPRVDAERVRATMGRLADQTQVLASDRRLLRTVAGLAAANWLLDAAALWVVLSAFGHRPGIVGLLVAYGLANVMAAIPISPGGLGVIEAVLIPTLVGFGTPRAEASIGVVAYRLVSFWLPIPVGALSYVAVERATSVSRPRGFHGEVNAQLARRGRDPRRGGVSPPRE
jgi:uncharacterized protein (TIRG00374 family)